MKRALLALPLAVVAALAVPACDTVPTIDCGAVTVKTYTELATSVMPYCTQCHGPTRAEEGYRYDTYEHAKAGAEEGAISIANGSMPDSGTMPEDARQEFYAWTQCGTPE